MIVRSVLRQLPRQAILVRGLVTEPPLPAVVQKVADTAIEIVEQHTGMTSTTVTARPSTSFDSNTSPASLVDLPTSLDPETVQRMYNRLTSDPVTAYSRSQVYVDPKTNPLLEFMSTLLMTHGHLHRARKYVAACLATIARDAHTDPLPIVKEAVRLASPDVKIIVHRKRAKATQIPFALSERQRTRQGLKWIIDAAVKRPEHGLAGKIAREMMDIVNGKSSVLEKKRMQHHQAIINRSNATVR